MSEDHSQNLENRWKSIISRYPPEKRYVLAIMQDVQREFNYLPREILKKIACHIGLSLSRVYSMATFYKAFSLKPRGQVHIKVCDGTACHLKGAPVLISELFRCLEIKPGETTSDGMFSLETVSCLGACAISPVVVANEKVHAKVTPAEIRRIIEEYKGENHEPAKR